jgi:L-aspartate oxidase
MAEPLTQRRYLIPFKASRLAQQLADVLVIGGGVAGLRAAIAAAEAGADVLVLTKDTIEQSNTWYAQGGIAAVLQPTDSLDSHIQDTLVCGAGLCDERAVRIVIEEGPKRVLELLSWGAHFDKKAAKAATAWPASSTPAATRQEKNSPRRSSTPCGPRRRSGFPRCRS